MVSKNNVNQGKSDLQLFVFLSAGSDVLGDDSDTDEDDGLNGSEDIAEQVQQLAMEEHPDNLDEQDPRKIKIHE